MFPLLPFLHFCWINQVSPLFTVFYWQVDISHTEFYFLKANFLFLNTDISFCISQLM